MLVTIRAFPILTYNSLSSGSVHFSADATIYHRRSNHLWGYDIVLNILALKGGQLLHFQFPFYLGFLDQILVVGESSEVVWTSHQFYSVYILWKHGRYIL